MSDRTSAMSWHLRLSQARRLLASEGAAGMSLRVRRRLVDRLLPTGTTALPLSSSDIEGAARAEANGFTYPLPRAKAKGDSLDIAWVCTPPGAGSGGHTTMFRMAAALEAAGHRSTLYLLDRHGWTTEQHRSTIRRHWPHLRADIRSLGDGVEDCDAIVATSWDTAYAVVGSSARGHRVYFVQDFEPMFYPSGSEYLLAEGTYRFKFHGIVAGGWLAELLSSEFGMVVDHFDFGSDPSTYNLEGSAATSGPRNGVAYYCRPHTPRRAHELAILALERFSRQHPDVPIHTYGSTLPSLPFPAVQHGVLGDRELAELYRGCVAGLSLSATNVSLVPLEMLGAGCVPVVNDASRNHVVLDNDQVVYAPPTPWGLASALSVLVDVEPQIREARARAAARSVADRSWGPAERTVVEAFEALVAAPLRATRSTSVGRTTPDDEAITEGGAARHGTAGR